MKETIGFMWMAVGQLFKLSANPMNGNVPVYGTFAVRGIRALEAQ